MINNHISLQLSQSLPKIQIDATNFQKAVNNLSSAQLDEKKAMVGMQQAEQGTKKIVQEGTKLMSIEQGYTVGRVVKERYRPQLKTINVICSQPINIFYQPMILEIKHQPKGTQADFWA